MLIPYSCSEENKYKNRIVKELSIFKKNEIIIPDNLVAINYGNQISDRELLKRPLKLVVYINQTGCEGCKMQELIPLYIFILQTKHLYKLGVLIIISSSDIMTIENRLQQIRFRYSIFYDLDGSFEKLNPNLPRDDKFHSFLINENHKVILFGNPALNYKLKTLYLNTLEKLHK